MFIFTNITYKQPGGTENLIYLIVRQLYALKREKVKIFGKSDSYLVRRLSDENIGFCFFDIDDITAYDQVSQNDVLILFANYYGLRRFKNTRCRVLVWDVLNYSLVTWNRMQFLGNIPGAGLLRDAFNKAFIRHLCARKAIVCMDGSTREDLCGYLHRNIHVELIQVPIFLQKNRYEVREKSSLAITYIGRGDEIWKVVPVKKILLDLLEMDVDASVHVFSSETELFEQQLASVGNGKIDVIYHLGYYGIRLQEALLEISDVNFSMGMSALESAALGIPTILIDPSIDKYPPGYGYRWLFESKDYSLGKFVSEHTVLQEGGLTMRGVYDLIMHETECEQLSALCHAYVEKNHAADIVLEKVLNHSFYADILLISKFMPNMWL